MIKAAGIIFVVGETALFLHRGNEWAFPGGRLADGETPEEAALREAAEETGFATTPARARLWTRSITPASVDLSAQDGDAPAEPEDAAPQDVDYTTWIVPLAEQFTPKLALDEHDGYAWAPINGAPEPLHPAARIALERFAMNELDVARAMAAGRLASPQRYENVWLFAIRITGTGASYRVGRKEFVWRDPALYLNDDFLARCNGLQVLWEHPEKVPLLNNEEFRNRTIGSVFLPYLREDRPDEVWAIVKIYDAEAARDMRDNQLSTSPGVNFTDPSVNTRMRLDNGRTMMIEGEPSLLDHVAICPAGVWDKGGDPEGVESVNALALADSLDMPAGALPAGTPRAHHRPHPDPMLRTCAAIAAILALRLKIC